MAPAHAEDVAAPKAESKTAAPAVERTPMLWEVDTKPKIYLFGTIHTADPRVLEHPPVVKKALEQSQALYTELEMDPESMKRLVSRVMLPPEESLAKLLPKDVYERTDKLFSAKGMPLKMLDRVKVWGVWMQLQTLDAPKAEPGRQALDVELFQGAKERGLTVGGLELPEEQIDIFDKLTLEEQIRLLDETAKAMAQAKKEGKSPLEDITRLYLAGDADKLFEVLFESTDMSDPFSRKLLHKLLDERNIRMVKRMLAKGQAEPDKTIFVAVGTGHYPGDMGILKLLERTGFRTRQLKTLADMDKPWPLKPKKKARTVMQRRRIKVGPFCLPGPCCPTTVR